MKRRAEHEDLLEDPIDLTPMVNVSLILVIVFMCVSPMALMTGIKAVGSKNTGVSIGENARDNVVKVILLKDGTITINGGTPIDKRNIVPYLKDAILLSPVKEVIITADSENIVQDVVYLMDISKQNGAAKVVISE